MKPAHQLMEEIKEAGLIYDDLITSMIVSYEVGHFMRNIFYAKMVGNTDDELQLRDGWLANAKVEFSDCITQCRILCEVMGWDWSDIINTGEAKLFERIDTYKQRGVRPNDTLMKSILNGFNVPVQPRIHNYGKVRVQRDGD